MTTVIATFPKNGRESVRIALERYRDRDLVDVRVCVPLTEATGLVPTKTGISLRVELLPELVRALHAAAVEARRQGLLNQEVAP